MPRKLKPYEMETISHRSGIEVKVFLDREDKNFFAEFSGEKFEGKDIDTVRRCVNTAIQNATQVTWSPVIVVHRVGGLYDKSMSSVGFSLERFYYGKRADGKMVKTDWKIFDPKKFGNIENPTDEDRNKQMHVFWWDETECGEFKPPFTRKTRGSTGSDLPDYYYLPYTDELWAGLNEMVQAIKRLNEHLSALLETPEGAATITSIGQQMIGLMLPTPIEVE